MTEEEIVLKYSIGMKQAILKRVIPPANESVAAVSRETGIAAQTIYYWKKQARNGTLNTERSEVKPSSRGPGEKLSQACHLLFSPEYAQHVFNRKCKIG